MQSSQIEEATEVIKSDVFHASVATAGAVFCRVDFIFCYNFFIKCGVIFTSVMSM